MSEMVERVAHAMYGPGWNRARGEDRATWLANARDAIKAMQEPTAAMEQAYLRACDESGACPWKTAYRVMVRAALGE